MSLLFGRLTQDFISFQLSVAAADANSSDSAMQAALSDSAAHFRKTASLDASYLVYIGEPSGILIFVLSSYRSYQVSGCLFARLFTCRYGFTPEKSTPSVYENDIFKPSYDKTSLISTLLGLVRSRRVFRPTPVSLQFRGCGSQDTYDSHRSRPAGYLRESRPGSKLPRCICDRFRPRIHSVMEIGSRPDVYYPLHCHYRRYHEQVHVRFHAVSPGLHSLPNVSDPPGRQSLGHVAAGGTVAEEVISTVRTAQAFGTQVVLAGLYDKYIEKSRTADLKAAAWHGGGLAVFFFVIYSSYALCESLDRSG